MRQNVPELAAATAKVLTLCRVGQRGTTDSWPHLCQILTDLKKILTERFLGKFAVKRVLKIPQYFAYVATLPRETLMSAKQAINDKLLGSLATYLTCGKVVNNHIKKGLLLSVWVKKWNRWVFDKFTSKNVIASCTLQQEGGESGTVQWDF